MGVKQRGQQLDLAGKELEFFDNIGIAFLTIGRHDVVVFLVVVECGLDLL